MKVFTHKSVQNELREPSIKFQPLDIPSVCAGSNTR